MKIAVISSHTPSIFWFRMDMMRSFLSLGHEVIAVGDQGEGDWASKFEDCGVRYVQVEVERTGTNPLKDLGYLVGLKKVLKEEQPDKIFTYQAKPVIYATLAANVLGITEVYPLIAGVGSVFLANSLKARIVRFILRQEYRLALGKCKSIFFQNNDDVEVFRANGILRKQDVALLRGSGVNLEHFRRMPLPKEPAFLYVGRLIRDKGVREYLLACQEIKKIYPKVRCMLVGPFDSNPTSLQKDELQQYIDRGVIEYFGEQEDVRPYLNACSVFVLPSYHEGTPKSVLEAMATGRAVLTTNAPGCRETVIHGKNGYLVCVKCVDELVQKMKDLIESPDVVDKMAAESRAMAEEIFDVRRVNQVICETMKL